jgi:hypothetical protein
MGFYYTPKTLMYTLDYQKDKELAKKLLKHDWRMISNIKNYNLELVAPHIKDSLTFVSKMYLPNAKDSEEMYKIIEYAYQCKNIFKKQIMDYVGSSLSPNKYGGQSRSLFDLSNKRFRNVVVDILEKNPVYILILTDSVVKDLFGLLKIDYHKYVSKINFEELKKLTDKINDNSRKQRLRPYEKLRDRYLGGSGWWGNEYSINSSNFEDKIEKMMAEFPDNQGLHSILLLWKMS